MEDACVALVGASADGLADVLGESQKDSKKQNAGPGDGSSYSRPDGHLDLNSIHRNG